MPAPTHKILSPGECRARAPPKFFGSVRAHAMSDHTTVLRKLLTYMMEDPRNIVFCAHLLFCSKNLARIGRHITNIAEPPTSPSRFITW
jgi:hypothetical protein